MRDASTSLCATLILCATLACPQEPQNEATCTNDGDCPNGSFCGSAGHCVAKNPCDDVTCGPGELCTNGECHPGGACGGVARIFPPAVLFVVDRSCSMDNELGATGVTKWEAAVSALSGTANALDDRLLFGLTLFPDITPDRCEQTDTAVTIGVDRGDAISTFLAENLDSSGSWFPDGPCVTNIDTAMSQAAAMLGGGTLDAQVVLVTDGRQAGCNEATGEADAAATMSLLFDYGIETVVVGFDRQADATVLDMFALAGGRPNPEADVDFYPATEPAALESTLVSLADDALDCAFRLAEAPPDPSALYVFVEETATAQFAYDSTTRTLSLSGDACAQLSTGLDVRVDVIFGGCPE